MVEATAEAGQVALKQKEDSQKTARGKAEPLATKPENQ